ncbi:MAG: PQQ-binding-like beta-propeller repeat protein, partial [Vicinamibacteria bacterium]|nr:PQQ-binding-like beta-propeller repeat protein [Vicinamibacteria bacterium]
MKSFVRLRALIGLAAAALAAPTFAGDWTQYLGPTGLGVSPETGVFKAGHAPKVAWKTALQTGSAGLAVAGGRAFTIARDDENDYVVALDLKDGREAWRVKLDVLPVNPNGIAAAATPAVGGDRVVTLSTNCQLRAHDVATGAVAWHRDLKADYAVAAPRPCAGSPLVEGTLALALLPGKDDAGFAAFELATGKTAWVAQGPLRTHYAETSLATLGGERVALVNHAVLAPPPAEGQRPAPPRSGVTALRVSDGAKLLSHTLDEGFSWEAPLLVGPDRLAMFTNDEMRLFTVAKDGAGYKLTPAATTRDVTGGLNPPFLKDGLFFGVRDDDFAAVDPETGQALWK